MLEWVCPRCRRAVDPGFSTCPFCGHSPEASQPSATQAPRRARAKFDWADVERGFRFGLGTVAALAIAYFLLFLAAFISDHPQWVDRLARWLRLH